jgi:hypothetical protein
VAGVLAITTALGAASLAGFVPTVDVSTGPTLDITPATGDLATEGFAPVVTAVAATVDITPAVGVVAVVGFVPAVDVVAPVVFGTGGVGSGIPFAKPSKKLRAERRAVAVDYGPTLADIKAETYAEAKQRAATEWARIEAEQEEEDMVMILATLLGDD